MWNFTEKGTSVVVFWCRFRYVSFTRQYQVKRKRLYITFDSMLGVKDLDHNCLALEGSLQRYLAFRIEVNMDIGHLGNVVQYKRVVGG